MHPATGTAKRPFHEAMSRRARRVRHGWQVFGLAGSHPVGAPTGRRFPVVETSACLLPRRRSFLHTAAGQSRILTRFPLAKHRCPARCRRPFGRQQTSCVVKATPVTSAGMARPAANRSAPDVLIGPAAIVMWVRFGIGPDHDGSTGRNTPHSPAPETSTGRPPSRPLTWPPTRSSGRSTPPRSVAAPCCTRRPPPRRSGNRRPRRRRRHRRRSVRGGRPGRARAIPDGDGLPVGGRPERYDEDDAVKPW